MSCVAQPKCVITNRQMTEKPFTKATDSQLNKLRYLTVSKQLTQQIVTVHELSCTPEISFVFKATEISCVYHSTDQNCTSSQISLSVCTDQKCPSLNEVMTMHPEEEH